MNRNRIRDIDFWRGAVLIAILIDHIPGNPLEHFTPRNFGLSDSAEAFVFLSGLPVGIIYMPRANKYGLEPVAGGLLRRALKIYGVHIALSLAGLVVFAAAYWMSGVPDLIEAHGRSYVFSSPSSGLPALALMSLQLGYFNILPLYVVLMLWAPIALAVARRDLSWPSPFRPASMWLRASSASTCRTGRKRAAGSSICLPGNSSSPSASSRRFCGATAPRGLLHGY